MNMNSIADPIYRDLNGQLCKAYEIAANSSVERASDEVASPFPTHQSGIPLARAKIDRAWQKLDHSLGNGIATVTVVNKCVDIHVL